MELTERQKLLLKLACDVLQDVNGYSLNLSAFNQNGYLEYDDAECDLGCLADDITDTFGLEYPSQQ